MTIKTEVVNRSIIFILLLFVGVLTSVQGQGTLHGGKIIDEIQEQKEGEGSVTIHQDEGIEFLLNTQIEMNRRSNGVDGWRIQLYSGSGPEGKKEAMQVKGKFLSEFSDKNVNIYPKFNPPFWRVRVGDYRHKHEALELLNELKKTFPNCYVVKDGAVRMDRLK